MACSPAGYHRRGNSAVTVNDAAEWSRSFQFHPFAIDVFSALGSAPRAAADQFARVQAMLLDFYANYCQRGTLQELSVALPSTNAKMMRCRLPQLSALDEGPVAVA